MAGIKYNLQKEVFDKTNEKLISISSVYDLSRKKKNSYLCILSSINPPTSFTICQVKQYDKGLYKKKRSWELGDLKVVDGKSEDPETYEFNLFVEKEYRWFASNLHERQNFITVLWKLVNKHVGTKPVFKNIPQVWLALPSEKKEEKEQNPDNSSDEIDAIEYEFNALTEREEGELNKWIKEYNYAISNAELFIEKLTENLKELDGANVQR